MQPSPLQTGGGFTISVTVTGDSADHVLTVSRNAAGTLQVNGGTVSIVGGTPTVANTTLIRILGLGGADRMVIDSANGTMPSGDLQGGQGDDLMVGGPGDDLLVGGDGNDVALAGGGDDAMVWNPGDDNDVLEGQSGSDRMLFNGANISENIDISANGGRVIFLRNIANVVMDLNDVEAIEYHALGGADNVSVNDLSGTDVTDVQVDLASPAGSGTGDGQADNITVRATNGNDVTQVVGTAGEASVFGLSAQVDIVGSEAANDRLTVILLDGDDVLEASGLGANAIQLTGDGGNNDDVLVGGDGNDTLLGGPGDDVLLGGPGVDVLDGGAGDNVVIQ